jgi:hypothetical protein
MRGKATERLQSDGTTANARGHPGVSAASSAAYLQLVEGESEHYVNRLSQFTQDARQG